MPRPGPTLAILLAAASVTLAQAPPVGQPAPAGGQPAPAAPAIGPPPAQPVPPQLMAHLQAWQQAMQGAQNFIASECTKVVDDAVRKSQSRYKGSIWCMKPNLARVRLEKLPPPGQQPNPHDYTTYICDGKKVYEYEGLTKTVMVYTLNNQAGGNNLLLNFIGGNMTAQQVVQRFDIQELPGKQNDPTYLFLEIRPREAADKAEFDTMTLVLIRPNVQGAQQLAYLPRIARIQRVNIQQVESWDFPVPFINAPNVKATDFKYIDPGKDWKVQQAQQPPAAPQGQGQPPRVVRQ